MKKSRIWRNKETIIEIIIIIIITAIAIFPIKNGIKERKNENNTKNNNIWFWENKWYWELDIIDEWCNCIGVEDPVCGENWITYWNWCQASCDWQKNFTKWECKISTFKRIINKLKTIFKTTK